MSSGSRAVTRKFGTSTGLADPQIDRAAARARRPAAGRSRASRGSRSCSAARCAPRATCPRSGSCRPCRTQMPVVAKKRRGAAISGGSEVVVAEEVQVADPAARASPLRSLEADVRAASGSRSPCRRPRSRPARSGRRRWRRVRPRRRRAAAASRPVSYCLMSMLPAVSRGGTVRSPSLAIGSPDGTAPSASGGSAKPPRSASSASRSVARLAQLGCSVPARRCRGTGRRGCARRAAARTRRRRRAVQLPVDDVRLRELVAQEAEAGHLDRVAPLVPRVGLDRHELALEQVAGLCALARTRGR